MLEQTKWLARRAAHLETAAKLAEELKGERAKLLELEDVDSVPSWEDILTPKIRTQMLKLEDALLSFEFELSLPQSRLI